jgi:hypothetical protein
MKSIIPELFLFAEEIRPFVPKSNRSAEYWLQSAFTQVNSILTEKDNITATQLASDSWSNLCKYKLIAYYTWLQLGEVYLPGPIFGQLSLENHKILSDFCGYEVYLWVEG